MNTELIEMLLTAWLYDAQEWGKDLKLPLSIRIDSRLMVYPLHLTMWWDHIHWELVVHKQFIFCWHGCSLDNIKHGGVSIV